MPVPQGVHHNRKKHRKALPSQPQDASNLQGLSGQARNSMHMQRSPWSKPVMSWLFPRQGKSTTPAIPMTDAIEGHYKQWSSQLAARQALWILCF